MTLTVLLPYLFWIVAPSALVLLLVFRLLRAKRTIVLAGSLMIWKRLAALPATAKPKPIVLDLSLILQAGAVLMLAAALSGPSLVPRSASARTVLIVLDNGTLSRARVSPEHPAFEHIVAQSAAILSRLDDGDRVFVARTAPNPILLNAEPLTPAKALELARQIVPALSGPSPSDIWLFATDRARALAPGISAQTAIVSLRKEPPEAIGAMAKWFNAAAETKRFDNVAIVAAGSLTTSSGARQILARLVNFSNQRVTGSVLFEALRNEDKLLEERPLTIEPNAEAVVGFAAGAEHAVRIRWSNALQTADALPEDDSVVMVGRPFRKVRIRFHSQHTALKTLFSTALDAELIPPTSPEAAPGVAPREIDLDVYAGSVPDRLPDDSRAALFVAPERGYRSFFDMGETPFTCRGIERGDDSPLTEGITKGSESGVAVPKAIEILHTGDFTTLLRDAASKRALAAKFIDEKLRPCYVLAFSPGDGFPDTLLLPKPLAAMLTRMALEASRAGPPYEVITAAALEAVNVPCPLDWQPSVIGDAASFSTTGSGVLDEHASDLRIEKSAANFEDALNSFLSTAGASKPTATDLVPWLIVGALLLAIVEFALAGR